MKAQSSYIFTRFFQFTDNACTTCECMIDPMTNEVFSQCNAPQCPPTDGMCDPEDIMTTSDGCCTYCATSKLG